MCRECDDGDVFTRECDLAAHVKKRHYVYRNRTNLEILHDCIYDKDCGPSHWDDALTFLQNLKWDAPPYRATMISKINYRLETNITDTFHRVTHASTEACLPVQHHKHNSRLDYNADPILALQVLFERLVLFPIPSSNPTTAKSSKRIAKHNSAAVSIAPSMIASVCSNKAVSENCTKKAMPSSANRQVKWPISPSPPTKECSTCHCLG